MSNEKNKEPACFSSYDSLTVYDGGSSSSSMMGKYCGDSIPPSHVSLSNQVLIQFHSDEAETETGFQIEYNPIGKQNTSIQNNTEGHEDRILRVILNIVFYIELIKMPL